MEPYRDSLEHLRDELGRLDLLLSRAIVMARLPRPDSTPEQFRGLVISEPEIDSMILDMDFLGDHWRRQEAAATSLHPIDEKLVDMRKQIDRRRTLTARSGRRLALPYVAERFGLSPAEVDILLATLAPELEPRYETLYAYLQDDVTRKHPSVDLILNLICHKEREKLSARRLFSPGAPLLRFRIIELHEDSQDRKASLLRRFPKVDDTVIQFLLEQTPAVIASGKLSTPRIAIHNLKVDDSARTQLRNLVDASELAGAEREIIRLIGPSPEWLLPVAEAIASKLKRPMLIAALEDLEGDPALAAVMFRDAAVWDAVPVITASDPGETEADLLRAERVEKQVWEEHAISKGPTILAGPATTFLHIPADTRIWRLDIAAPDFDARKDAWREILAGTAADPDLDRLADSFRFGANQIWQTYDRARSIAALRSPYNTVPSLDDLLEAGRGISTPRLGRFATPIEPRYGWDDLVLPEDKLQQLRSVATRVKYRRQVHRDWGFGEKLSRGKGINLLFTGHSGTGKSMTAEVLGKDLGLTIFQIDLSSVVSKYIGETEKHLSAIFQEAETGRTLLFFDEADALFGKRTEVKDAHDRYANIEVNYLLQRIEQFDGVVILATNLQRNLDDAFVRRMQEVIDFPFPDETLREQIWLRHFPKNAPRMPDIDFRFLAKNFKMTGGGIRNVVLSAAFRAAEEGKDIGMVHIIPALKAEFQKEGKLVLKGELGRYFELAETTVDK